jgi:hypothetical protein
MAAVSSRVFTHCWLLILAEVSAACLYKCSSLENGNIISDRMHIMIFIGDYKPILKIQSATLYRTKDLETW